MDQYHTHLLRLKSTYMRSLRFNRRWDPAQKDKRDNKAMTVIPLNGLRRCTIKEPKSH